MELAWDLGLDLGWIWAGLWARCRLGVGRVRCAPIVVAMVLAVMAAVVLAAAIAD